MRFKAAILLFFVAIFLGVFRVQAQSQPPKNVIAGRLTVGARAVHAVDLDGDGDEDILTASFTDGKIAWYENEGEDIFSKQKVITTDASGAAAVYAADLDNDGDLDVVSGSYENIQGNGDDKLAWYENVGGGTFSGQKIIEDFFEDGGVWSVHVADLNENGAKDIVLTTGDDFFGAPDDGKIAWYENTGNSSFSSDQQVIATDLGAASVHTADVDGDDDMDVLSKSTEGGIAWYLNVGGSFSEVVLNNSDGAISVHFTDMDGDGDEDVLSSSSGKIVWYEKFENGFSPNQKIITDDANEVKSVYPADLDRDSDMDVLSAESGANKISAYENQGSSNFGELVITTEATEAQFVYATNIDDNEDPDVISASPGDDKIAWYSNRLEEGQEFSDPKVLSSQKKSLSNLSSIHAADLDGDGHEDVLSSSYVDFDGNGNDKVAWYRNEGDRSFSRQKIIATEANGARSVYAADLDGDNDQDVLSGSFEYFDGSGDDKVVWYENEGDGSFSDEKIIMTDAGGVVSVYAADLDDDTDQDVLIAAENADKIAWFENVDNGDFSNQKVVNTSADFGEDGNADEAQSVYTSDLDGDEDQDLISASQGDDKIAWYENTDGDGSFSEQKVITTNAGGAESVYAGDVDGDGDKDVFAASSRLNGDSKITWYENNGNGSFSEQQQVATGLEGAQAVHGADVDGDGSVGILSTYTSGVVWHKESSSFGSISFSNETIDSEGGDRSNFL
jgi:hypothetical protein